MPLSTWTFQTCKNIQCLNSQREYKYQYMVSLWLWGSTKWYFTWLRTRLRSHPIPPTKFSFRSFVLIDWVGKLHVFLYAIFSLYFFWQIPQQLASIQLLLPAMYTGLPCSDKLGLPGSSRSPKAFWCYRYDLCKFFVQWKDYMQATGVYAHVTSTVYSWY